MNDGNSIPQIWPPKEEEEEFLLSEICLGGGTEFWKRDFLETLDCSFTVPPGVLTPTSNHPSIQPSLHSFLLGARPVDWPPDCPSQVRPSQTTMEIHEILKIVSIPVIFLMSISFAMLPLLPRFVPKRARPSKYSPPSTIKWRLVLDICFSLANMLAGGFVLGTGLMHMLPDSQEYFEQWFSNYIDPDPDHHFHHHHRFDRFGDDGDDGGDHDHDSIMAWLSEFPWAMAIASASLLCLLFIEQLFIHNHGSSHSHSDSQKLQEQQQESQVQQEQKQQHQQFQSTAGPEPSNIQEIEQALISSPSALAMAPSFDSSSSKNATLSALTMTMALGVHSAFEGLGFGAIEHASGTYSVMFALLAHKFLEAFALGLAIARAKFRIWLAVFVLLLYSCMTPAATAAGIVIQQGIQGGWSALVAAIFSSVAAGSFLYIACFEMIPSELHNGRHVILKFSLVALGCGAMGVLAFFV